LRSGNDRLLLEEIEWLLGLVRRSWNARNPANVREYLEKWGKEDADVNEGLDGEGEEFVYGDDDLEVVVTEEEEDEEGASFTTLL
jgi:hypothetical protein